MEKEIKKLMEEIKKCAKEVYEELGPGWEEKVHQKDLEVALRERGITYEDKRILPVSFKGHVVGEGIPDLVVWLNKGKKRIAIVIDLKWETHVKFKRANRDSFK